MALLAGVGGPALLWIVLNGWVKITRPDPKSTGKIDHVANLCVHTADRTRHGRIEGKARRHRGCSWPTNARRQHNRVRRRQHSRVRRRQHSRVRIRQHSRVRSQRRRYSSKRGVRCRHLRSGPGTTFGGKNIIDPTAPRIERWLELERRG